MKSIRHAARNASSRAGQCNQSGSLRVALWECNCRSGFDQNYVVEPGCSLDRAAVVAKCTRFDRHLSVVKSESQITDELTRQRQPCSDRRRMLTPRISGLVRGGSTRC
jgi:hypothetical protein